MVKFNRKTLFEQWLSPFNQQLFEEQAKTFQLNDATTSYTKLRLYAHLLHEKVCCEPPPPIANTI